MILVTGATGNVGAELVRALAAAGQPVRAVTRDPARIAPQPGVEYVAGDLNRPESLEPALDGVRGLFLLPGYPDMPRLLADAGRAGVARVVLLSGGSAGSGDLSRRDGQVNVSSVARSRGLGLGN